MSKEKPKKGGMVLIIGMGEKPKKEKDGVKKADEMTAPRKRGGLGNRERKRLFAFKNRMRGNPNLLEETLSKLKIPEKMFRMYLQKVEGKSLEEAKNGDTNFPKLIDEVKRINNANMGQFDETGNVKNKKLQESMQNQGIRLKDFKQSMEEDPFMNFQDRMAKLRSERGPRIRLDRAPKRRVGQKKKGKAKGDMFDTPGDDPEERTQSSRIRDATRAKLSELGDKLDSEENYKDLYSQMFQGIEEADSNDPRNREKEEDKFTDFVGDEVDESAGSDRHFRMLERLYQANQRDPTEAALRELGQGDVRVRDERKTQGQNFPGFTVEGRVARTPSTEFDPQTPRGRLSSPQEENRIATSSDSRNVMNPAWVLLKGAMKTVDLIAQETNTMEEALRSMKESFPNMPSQQAIQLVTEARNQQARERMSMTQTQPMRALQQGVDPRLVESSNPSMNAFKYNLDDDDVATSSDSRNVMNPAWALLKGNPAMRDAEGRAINHPAATVYENLATQVDTHELENVGMHEEISDRMEQMRNPTHQKRVMDRLKQGKHATPLDLTMAAHNDKAEQNRLNQHRQFARDQTRDMMELGNDDEGMGDDNHGIQQSTGTDVRMKPGNIMEQM